MVQAHPALTAWRAFSASRRRTFTRNLSQRLARAMPPESAKQVLQALNQRGSGLRSIFLTPEALAGLGDLLLPPGAGAADGALGRAAFELVEASVLRTSDPTADVVRAARAFRELARQSLVATPSRAEIDAAMAALFNAVDALPVEMP